MNRKFWLVVFLLCSLILLLGGTPRPKHAADADDPVLRSAEATVSQAARGSAAEWQRAARENPLWILEIEAGGE